MAIMMLLFFLDSNFSFFFFSLPFKLFEGEEGGHDARSLTWYGVLLVLAVASEVFTQTADFWYWQSTKAGPPVGYRSVWEISVYTTIK